MTPTPASPGRDDLRAAVDRLAEALRQAHDHLAATGSTYQRLRRAQPGTPATVEARTAWGAAMRAWGDALVEHAAAHDRFRAHHHDHRQPAGADACGGTP
ncbi:hypothetical protein ACIBG7_43090 [Nonomuraea sp. NPDC050328]|uniref:hypothetical protein n=1 Tax=Nonomuraea sp. NPDC050328 TaxID=3364361 RepID=UPI003791AE27